MRNLRTVVPWQASIPHPAGHGSDLPGDQLAEPSSVTSALIGRISHPVFSQSLPLRMPLARSLRSSSALSPRASATIWRAEVV